MRRDPTQVVPSGRPSRRVRGLLVPSLGAYLLGASLVTALGLGVPAYASAQADATWYITTYSNDMLVWDEASERVVDRIRMRNFIPTGIIPNEAGDRLYVSEASGEIMEVVDLATRSVVDEFTLTEGNVRVRIDGFAPHPSDRKAILTLMRYTKGLDRYTVEGPFLVEYDLVAKQVTDTISLPEDEEPDGVGLRYAPDGRTLYVLSEDIIALDADTYEEVDRWALSQPLEPGLGRTSLGTLAGTYDEPGTATALFRMTDPAQNRRMMGVSQVRLAERDVDFFTLGTAEPVGRFTLAPGGQKAYALLSAVGRYEFWEFDLPGRRVTRRQPFEGRPRMGLAVSADGSKLYIFVAGNTIDVYDATTFEKLRTVEFDEDMTDVQIIPGSAQGR